MFFHLWKNEIGHEWAIIGAVMHTETVFKNLELKYGLRNLTFFHIELCITGCMEIIVVKEDLAAKELIWSKESHSVIIILH